MDISAIPEFERLYGGVRVLALRELGERDLAEEVAQETMSRAVRAVSDGRLADPEKLGAFVRGIARHVITDVRRANRREVRLVVERHDAPASVQDPLSALLTDEQQRSIHSALAKLSPADRELLRLTFFENCGAEELAVRLNEPSARIRKRKERAIDRLRRAFLAATGARHLTPSISRGTVLTLQKSSVAE